MDFLLYLTSDGKQLLNDLISARFRIRENIGLCRTSGAFGETKLNKTIVICTNNIKKYGSPYQYVEETLTHEAVHAAQICRRSMTLGLSKSKMPLPPNKLTDVQNSLKITGNRDASHAEHEAYYLEDKPSKVRYYVRKFCF